MAKRRFYQIMGDLIKAEDHRYGNGTIYTIHGKIMQSVSEREALDNMSSYRRPTQGIRKHFRSYAIAYRSDKKKQKKKKEKQSNISWLPKKKKK